MVTPLDVAIEISDLFEATGYEGTELAEMFDNEILPMLKSPLHETDVVGMGDRFSKAIDRVRASLSQMGGDRIRTLMDMMKSSILTYIQRTHDVRTGRDVFNRAIKSGGDMMLTVTGAAMLANALASNHTEQAQTLLRGIAAKLSGAQPKSVAENASGAAVSSGAIAAFATGNKKRKAIMRRRDSIFAEGEDEDWDYNHDENDPIEQAAWRKRIDKKYPTQKDNPHTDQTHHRDEYGLVYRIGETYLSWNDLEGQPDTIQKLGEVADTMENMVIEGVIIDPSTAELVLAVHDSLAGQKQRRYASKPVCEMIEIAHRAVQRGIISVVME